MSEPQPELFRAPIVWVGQEDIPVYYSNNFVAQFSGPGEFLLMFGYLAPPLLLGSDDERRTQAEQISYVAVKPVARIGLNRERVQELIRVLQENLANHDAAFEVNQE